jgi:hypothetical protein
MLRMMNRIGISRTKMYTRQPRGAHCERPAAAETAPAAEAENCDSWSPVKPSNAGLESVKSGGGTLGKIRGR